MARLEQARIALGTSEIADRWRPCAGGTAAMGTPGTWINAVYGAGMAGPVDPAEIAEVVAWYEAAGIEPRIEVCPYADQSFHDTLMKMGFVTRGYESLLYSEIDATHRYVPPCTPPEDLTIEVVDRNDEAKVREFALTAVGGFMPPGESPAAHFVELSMACVRHPRTICIVARLSDGRAAGAGSLEVHSEICALFGLSVLPEYRRRGLQQAMIAWRMNAAAERGAKVATIGSKPGIPTERNVRRMGFSVAYTQPVMARPRAGLVPVAGA